MTVRNFNNVTTIGTLVAPIAASAVSVSVQDFNQAPAVPFTVTIDRNLASEEICLVTAQSGGALTVVRGFDGSAAQSHAAGSTIEHTAGAIEYTEANQHVNASVGVHGTTGDLVGAEGDQTLFDKTLVSPLVQADVSAGDAVVAYDPTGSKNLFRGISSTGASVITVGPTGAIAAPSAAITGTASVGGTLSANGGIAVPAGKTATLSGGVTSASSHVTGAETVDGALTVGGAAALNGGASVPTGKKVTLTDAPGTGTDAANKTYVDGKTWLSAAVTDAVPAATASVVVKRDAAGRAQFADPAVAQDAATKNYVDNRVVHGWVQGTASTTTVGASGNWSISVPALPTTIVAGMRVRATLSFLWSTSSGTATQTFNLSSVTATNATVANFQGYSVRTGALAGDNFANRFTAEVYLDVTAASPVVSFVVGVGTGGTAITFSSPRLDFTSGAAA